MTTYKLTLLVLFTCFNLMARGQSVKVDSQYSYPIIKYLDPSQRPVLLKNQITGIVDTSLACVYGKVVKDNNNPLSLAIITLKTIGEPQEKFVSRTDRNGEYQIYIKPGNYYLTMESTTPLYLNNLHLGSGERREIHVKLKGKSSYMTTKIKSNKPLTDEELKKHEKHYD